MVEKVYLQEARGGHIVSTPGSPEKGMSMLILFSHCYAVQDLNPQNDGA